MSKCRGCNGYEVDEKLKEIAEKYSEIDGGIMQALHEVQNEYGYIPEHIQKYLSKEFNVPMSDIYGIITFYSRFSLTPKGKYNIEVCLGTACYVRGAEEVLNTIKRELNIKEGEITKDGKFSLEGVRCVGACGLAPVVVINSEVYGKMTPEKIKEILSKYL